MVVAGQIDEEKLKKFQIIDDKVEEKQPLEDPLFDKYCDPNNPTIVKREDVKVANEMIEGGIVRTPLTRTRLSDEIGMELYFKKEYMQFTASFKDRGALYALMNLTEEQKQRGVVTTSAGNHSQAMAYQAGKLNIPVTVFMPETAPRVKVNSCKKLKAIVVLHGKHFDEARARAMDFCRDNDLVYINGYDHPDIIAGQGTMGLEIMEKVPDLDYIVVPIGGGGMIAGIVAAVKEEHPDVKIIGVESKKCPSWTTAVNAGKPISCQTSIAGAINSVTDGLSVIQVGINAFASSSHLIDRVVCIDEDYVSLAVLKLVESEKAVVEGAGASGFAAILSGCLPELKGKKVACILCGGNIDATTLCRVMERGLMMDGRIIKFSCVVSDRSGGLSELVKTLAELGVSIRDIGHERMMLPGHVYKVRVTVTAETLDREHSCTVKKSLSDKNFTDINWME